MNAVVVCHAMCWPCLAGQHYDPPEWHTWADEDDVTEAEATGRANPAEKRCGCHCAETGEVAS